MRAWALALSCALGCGGTSGDAVAEPATSTVSTGDERAAAASPPVGRTEPAVDASGFYGRWFTVASVTGRGMSVGSRLRFTDGQLEACSGTQGQAIPTTCDAAAPATPSSCSVAGLEVAVRTTDAGFVLDGGAALTLTLEPASDADGAACVTQIDAQTRRTAACVAAAECCMAAEPTMGSCDLNTQLGDRSLVSCEAARVRVRAALDERGVALPDSCR